MRKSSSPIKSLSKFDLSKNQIEFKRFDIKTAFEERFGLKNSKYERAVFNHESFFPIDEAGFILSPVLKSVKKEQIYTVYIVHSWRWIEYTLNYIWFLEFLETIFPEIKFLYVEEKDVSSLILDLETPILIFDKNLEIEEDKVYRSVCRIDINCIFKEQALLIIEKTPNGKRLPKVRQYKPFDGQRFCLKLIATLCFDEKRTDPLYLGKAPKIISQYNQCCLDWFSAWLAFTLKDNDLKKSFFNKMKK